MPSETRMLNQLTFRNLSNLKEQLTDKLHGQENKILRIPLR
jgi:hypothetical protein